MIIGNINECGKYYSVNPHFKEAFELIKSLDVNCKNYKSDNIRVMLSSAVTSDLTKDGTAKMFEAHKNYIDIHYIIDGTEAMGYANVNDLEEVTKYNSEEDCQMFKGEISKIRLNKGDFCIAFPEDAHIPCMKVKEEANVKRCVLKIHV